MWTQQTCTFFGHWSSAGELIIDHAVSGEHQDLYPDVGQYDGGLWCGHGTGLTFAVGEAEARAAATDHRS